MAKKLVKSKQKQKQKQSQKVIVNISNPKSSRSSAPPQKQYLPMMPSFNINPAQPQQSTDLAKLIGFLIPKLQTNSTLASAIPVKVEIPETQKPVDIGGLKNSKEQPTLGAAIESAVIPPSSLEQKQMANEDMLSVFTQYPQPSKEPIKRRNKQQMEEAKQMGREDISSVQLGLSRFNYTPPISTQPIDAMSEISTEPLYEGGREAKPKRPYVRSGIYAGVAQKRKEKANTKKQFSEYQKE
jgi:hypothetical protein